MGTIRHATLLIGALLLSHQGFAAEFTVDTDDDTVDISPGDGVCVTAPGQCTLRAAIQETNALIGVDSINLPSGTYELTIPSESSESEDRQGQQFVDESGDLDIIDELTIIGSGPEATVIDASPVSARVVHIAPGATVRLEGLRIQGGRGVGDGGGIHNAGVLTMGDCVVSDNNAERFSFFRVVAVEFTTAGHSCCTRQPFTTTQRILVVASRTWVATYPCSTVPCTPITRGYLPLDRL